MSFWTKLLGKKSRSADQRGVSTRPVKAQKNGPTPDLPKPTQERWDHLACPSCGTPGSELARMPAPSYSGTWVRCMTCRRTLSIDELVPLGSPSNEKGIAKPQPEDDVPKREAPIDRELKRTFARCGREVAAGLIECAQCRSTRFAATRTPSRSSQVQLVGQDMTVTGYLIDPFRKTSTANRRVTPVAPEVTNIPPWRKGEENPVARKVGFRSGDLTFGCPTCQREMTISLAAIDPIVGHHLQCAHCHNISHIPGILRKKREDLTVITGAVSVKIGEFTDWYYMHPVFKSLLVAHDSNLLEHYGLWAFCKGCYHEYSSTVLVALPFALDAKKYGGQFMFNANTQQSAQDMKALTAGGCSSCGHTELLVIMTSIPQGVRNAITSWESRR
jgi:hypothetical protein